MKKANADTVIAHTCQNGMQPEEAHGVKWVRNTTRWMSSSNAMPMWLSARCKKGHEHMSIPNGRF